MKGKKQNKEIVSEALKFEISNQLDTSKGRYIKGDPLKGYYDFIMNVASYKFWAGLQVFMIIFIIDTFHDTVSF